ncbi:uncharacterized protein K02A2.6-like [Haplochromis burtoni]|uniref:uncharacterized protein K02A2.6-like n=1 Tax=Haplochromis burtoni TaxID=8153 RepID=UPI001C2D66F0|nr:uncharacterized protein K02A2.6-like [Haplochromis burtoni]
MPNDDVDDRPRAGVSTAASTPSATFSIQPPEPFDFSKPHEWTRWVRRFERFRQASNLSASSEENQVNTLIYCMGDEADDVLRGLKLSDVDQRDYAKVRDSFHNFFIVRKNVVYERARFNMRKQEPNETVDAFVTALHALAEHCNYGPLHDELIRDRIVVGLADTRLSERMQMEKDLDLDKAINMARQSEEIKKQQSALRSETNVMHVNAKTVDRVIQKHDKTKFNMFKNKTVKTQQQYSKRQSNKCYKCGGSPHPKPECPANDAKCHLCGKKGHYQRVCRQSKTVQSIEEEEEQGFFLGSVSSDGQAWTAIIQVKDAKITFKLDTGADVTVIADSDLSKIFANEHRPVLQQPEKPLLGPGKTPLDVAGFTKLQLNYGAKQTTEKVYVVRNLSTPLLGLPAITALGLLVRVDAVSMDTLKTTYPKLCNGLGKVQRAYHIKLKPNAVPYSLKTPRRLPLPLMGRVKEELQRMEELGVITRVEEPTDWCAGMVVVPKKNSPRLRLCVDFTGLNEYVCREKYVLPSVEQSLGMLAGAKVFSKLDANMGFWQIPLSDESAKLTTFITPFGRFHFNRLPFGINSAPEHFQRMMAEVIEGLEGVVCHIDDVLVWGRNHQEHDSRLHATLQRLEKAGITLNVEKCELSQSKVAFLGHIIADTGISPDPKKTEAITEMTEPTNVSELRSFLGMVNQVGKFIPHLAEKDKALRDLLSKKNAWYWGTDQVRAFKTLRDALTSPPVLAMYDPNRDIKVSADASSYGLGGVLLQLWEEGWRPVAYASRSLSPTEQRYAQVEKEALASTWACERFRDFLIGKHFCLETDHKPLVSLLGGQALDLLPPRIQRFRMRLMRYSYTVQYAPGKSLWTADTLSRSPLKKPMNLSDKELMESTDIYVDSIVANMPVSSSYMQTLKEQLKSDSVCARVMDMCTEGWPEHAKQEPLLRNYWPDRATLTVEDGLLLKDTRLVIPSAMRNEVLEKLHEGHQGVVKCKARARQTVWWPGLSQQISEMVLKCKTCIQERHNNSEPLMPTEYPARPWQRVGTDLFELGGETYLLAVDYHSRFVEIALLNRTKSNDVITHLKSFFARHGIPEVLMSDNGPQYSGRIFTDFAAAYGFKHITSSPKFPQSNGEAERAVQTVKNLLKKAADPYLALLAYRATPLQSGYSPAELLMGRRLRTTLPMLPSQLEPTLPDNALLAQKEREKRMMDMANFNRRHRAKPLCSLSPGEQVWVTDVKTTGTVIQNHSTPRSYTVELPQGTVRRNRVHLIPLSSPVHEPANVPVLQKPQTPSVIPATPVNTDVVRTKSGRPIVKPKKLDL